ncbi:potassium uptake protein, TrkH family [Thioflavicoccus mobilis 8321]|uniref:Trk system potassium uptake protein n=1 Tax=Thioflavicoccus mobilis 8321 TaxID=765912 RepID=L0GW58_9GAMM|nr:TrkH family potassium uptake protein [Thioflavicoccus mobilis]AGA90062.1 potassium uptake protein, TrkH family [Thioflavicoccus mobilis 8321]
MNWRGVIRLIGILLTLYALSFIPPLLLALAYQDGEAPHFLAAWIISTAIGLAIWLPVRAERSALGYRDGFLVVALFWAVLGVVGSIPFIVGLHLGVTDAIFESVSGFTTTGATVIAGIDDLPPSILYHRQQIQWLGGMGVVILAVAILPLLGVGGMQLYRAEASGITKDEKLTPRITKTAQVLWSIYFALTLACTLAYWAAGMNLFDAVGHAFSTVSTAGFSTHDASIGYFDSLEIELICVVFMTLGGVNFAIHFVVWHRRNPLLYLRDPEVRTYLLILLGAILFIAISLLWFGTYTGVGEALRRSLFEVVSVITTTGFSTADFATWPRHIPLVLVMLAYVGGCAGSTAGGLKVVRVMLLAKMGVRQMFVLSHPRAMAPLKLGRRGVPEDAAYSIWGYYVLYLSTALVLTVAMMAAGLDLESAFGAVSATLNLLGPGLGDVATTFAAMSPLVKWLAIFGMLVGRLEVFTLLILFTFAFWRQ